MLPMVIRLLGALAPKTEEGTIIGAKATAVAATEEPFKNSRRLMLLALRGLTLVITFPCLSAHYFWFGFCSTIGDDTAYS
jgi:hypothetical protein